MIKDAQPDYLDTLSASQAIAQLHRASQDVLAGVADRKLVPAQYDLCRKWYHPVVHELLRILEIKDEWEVLATALRPAMSPTSWLK